MNLNKITLAVLASASVSVWANEAAETEHIQVWGTQVHSSSVFMDDIEIAAKQPDHLSDLLRNIPGVEVGGTHSTNQRINIRGLDDTDLEVLVDGAFQNNYMFHHAGNLQVNPDILKSVDVQVGANSVVHNGLGGAVEFRTKSASELLQGNDAAGGRVLAGYNSNASHYLSLTGYAQLSEQFDVLGYVNRLDTDNFEDGNGVENLGMEGTINNALAKFGWNISDKQRLSAKFDVYRNNGLYTLRPDMGVALNTVASPNEDGTGPALYDTDFNRDTHSLHYELDLGDLVNLRADLYRNHSEFGRFAWNTESLGESTNTGLTVIANSTFGDEALSHQFTYGVKYIEADAQSTHVGEYPDEGWEDSKNLGVFIEDRIEFGAFAFTPGIRFNRFEKQTSALPFTQDFVDWQSALAAEYRINNAITLLASTTGLFKGPEQGEIYVNSQAGNVYNPNLEPETGRNNEVGLRYAQDQVMGVDSVRFAATYFETDIDNYISDTDYAGDDCTGRGCPDMQANVGEVTLNGFESSLLLVKNAVDVLVTYSRADMDSTKLDPGNYYDLREVGDSASVKLGYDLSAFNASVSWTWRKVMEKETATLTKEAYDVHNIAAVWEPSGNGKTSVILGIENVFDEIYVSHASRIGAASHLAARNGGVAPVINDYEAGRNIKLSVSYQF